METFRDAYFCAAKYKVHHPDNPLYLVLCGNDSLERVFGNMRLKAGHVGFDVLGLIHCSRSICECQEILNRHPSWTNKRDKVMTRLCLDYSSTHNWDTDKLKMSNVGIHEAWNAGRLNAEVSFKSTVNYPLHKCYFFALMMGNNPQQQHQITLLRPKGTKVGLNPVEVDWSLDDYDNGLNVTDVEDETTEDASIADYIDQSGTEKVDSQVEIDGKLMYKASIVCQLFHGEGASKDHLRRVQGLSRFAGASESDTDLHDMLIGDPVVVYGTLIPKICIVQKIKTASKHQESSLDEEGNRLIWTGKYKEASFKIPGAKFQPIKSD